MTRGVRYIVEEGEPTAWGGRTVKLTFASGYRRVAEDAEGHPADTAPFDTWIMAHWPHMVNTGGSLTRFGGWFPSLRTAQGWRARFGSWVGWVHARPSRWKPEIEEAA